MSEEAEGPTLHRVELEVDPAILVASEEHQADLIREFQLISLGALPTAANAAADHGPPLPKRLADLIVELLSDYRGTQEENLTRAHAALEQGDPSVRLEMDLPEATIGAIEGILGALEEADAFCRRGDGLLTLATPTEIAEARRGFFIEVSRQIRASADIERAGEG